MKDPKVIWAWVGGAIIVIALVTGIVLYFHHAPKTSLVAVHAPVGQLVSGFPPALVLDNASSVTNSYTINYSSSTNQYTAEWNSSSSVDKVYTDYQSYIQKNGWMITSQLNYPTLKYIYATNTSSSITVAITNPSNTTSSKVTITYVSK